MMKCAIRYRQDKKLRYKTIYLVDDVYKALTMFKQAMKQEGLDVVITRARLFNDELELRRIGHFGDLKPLRTSRHCRRCGEIKIRDGWSGEIYCDACRRRRLKK